MEFDVAILGAGAAGLMAAAWLNEHSRLSVCVIEGNTKPGAKVRISGGGKCNLTNTQVSERNYLGDAKLVREVFRCFDRDALLQFVKERGCEKLELRKGRYYFCPRSAQQMIDLLLHSANKSRFLFGQNIKAVVQNNEGFRVETDKETVTAGNVIVATGGISYASVGASDIGLKIAESFGIETVPFSPALAGLTLQKDQFWMKALSGISFPVAIRVGDKRLREEMLFAHRGISGPVVLSASLYWEKGMIEVDFLDGQNVGELVKRGGNKKLSTALPLPKRFILLFLAQLGVEDKPCSAFSTDEKKVLYRFSTYRFAPAGTFGFTKAEVSKGGVSTDALQSCCCEAKKSKGLYFVGEVVNVTGELGGYNFQWAFSSAVSAAVNIMKFKGAL